MELGIPLLGPHPATYAALSTRAACTQFFQAASLTHPPVVVLPDVANAGPGEHDTGADRGDVESVAGWAPSDVGDGPLARRARVDERLVVSLANAIVDHNRERRWMVKLEGERRGRGLAYMDVA